MGLKDLPFGKDPWRKAVAAILDTLTQRPVGEYNTGRRTFDDKIIYGKEISFGALPDTTQKSVAHGIVGAEWIDIVKATTNSGSIYIPLPRVSEPVSSIDIFVSGANISILTKRDYPSLGYTETRVTLEYNYP